MSVPALVAFGNLPRDVPVKEMKNNKIKTIYQKGSIKCGTETTLPAMGSLVPRQFGGPNLIE